MEKLMNGESSSNCTKELPIDINAVKIENVLLFDGDIFSDNIKIENDIEREPSVSPLNNSSSLNRSEEFLDVEMGLGGVDILSPSEQPIVISEDSLEDSEQLDIKKEIKIEDTSYLDGSNFLQNIQIDVDFESEPSVSTLKNSENKSEKTKDDESQYVSSEGTDDEIDDVASNSGEMRRIECPFCDYTKSSFFKIREHIDFVHFGLKNQKCKFCDFTAGYTRDIKTHSAAVHKEIKNYDCKLCDHSATNSSELKNHFELFHGMGNSEDSCEASKLSVSSLKNGESKEAENGENESINETNVYTEIGNVTSKRQVKTNLCKSSDYNSSRDDRMKQCRHCDFTASTFVHIEQHMTAVHPDFKNYKCEQKHCDYASNERVALTRHIQSVHRKIKIYACERCNYTAIRPNALKYHVKTVHEKIIHIMDEKKSNQETTDNYKCKHCNYRSNNRKNFNRHISNIHFKPMNQPLNQETTIVDYTCKRCDFRSSDRLTFNRHIDKFHNMNKCEECSYHGTDENLKKHYIKVHLNIETYKCYYCDFTTTVFDTVRKHTVDVHHKMKCQHCNYTAWNFGVLTQHIIDVHHKNKNNARGNTASSSATIKKRKKAARATIVNCKRKQNISALHRTLKDYKCESCGFVFNNHASLVRHIEIGHQMSR